MTMSAMLLPEFDQEMKSTRKLLERVPEGRFDFRPHPKSRPLGPLASHIADIPRRAVDVVEKESLDVAPQGAAPPRPAPAASRQEILDRFDANVAAARAALAGATDAQLVVPWSLVAGGHTLFTVPRIGAIRAIVLSHIIHHRAQLGVYLRINDVPVPAIYGPSADEGAF
ncbi:MAG TPA: DinB family protein [Thermoanaerobaculia bacterium]|nr:DinB family protein [Thermoanaerobaculia bacterium]